jgi:hypothetical protein
MEQFMEGGRCVMCDAGVHWEAGRVACDNCNLPTDCCLCEPGKPAPPPAEPNRPWEVR